MIGSSGISRKTLLQLLACMLIRIGNKTKHPIREIKRFRVYLFNGVIREIDKWLKRRD